MADQWVLASQQWLNKTFGSASGWTKVTEDGNTGQGTVNGLIEGLQNLLGISPVVASFGPTTWTKLQAHGNVTGADSAKWVTLVQAALYCKGYSGASLDGKWADTLPSIKQLSSDLGLGSSVTGLTPKTFRALLSTDPAVKIAGGSDAARAAQQYLNATYGSHTGFYYNSTGGVFDRSTQQNLVRGIQYELGQTDSAADGAFGPGTGGQLKANTAAVVRVGSTGRWVSLFKAALIFNGYPVTFNSTFTAADSTVAKRFQQFEAFTAGNQSGIGDYATWAELIVSTGDPNRPGTAADMASTITAARAASLKAAGYTTVGRYLTNEQVTSPLDKVIKPGELQTIFNAGLRLFPIFEEGGYEASWFSAAQGAKDAQRAYDAANGFGIPAGTIVYFAVDVDVTDDQTNATVIPYFRGIAQRMAQLGGKYTVGVYGARHVCALVNAAGLARASFIAGLSTGFAGNLGFALPSNWAFNQIQTLTIGSGSGAVEIDKNVSSGRDVGIGSTTTPSAPASPLYAWLDALQVLAEEWVASGQGSLDLPAGQLVLQYMRFPSYGAGDSVGGNAGSLISALQWDVVAGVCDVQWIDWATKQGVGRINSFKEPSHFGVTMDTQHLAASTDSVRKFGVPNYDSPNIGDGGGWAGDLYSIVGQWQADHTDIAPYTWALAQIGTINSELFGIGDFFEDMDAIVMGDRFRKNPSARANEVFRDYYDNHAQHRFAETSTLRFGGTAATLLTSADNVMSNIDNLAVNLFRAKLIEKFGGDFQALTDGQKHDFARAFADVYLINFFNKE